MISIRHLRKEYENSTPLKDVNAEIKKGDVISVIGPSGTGKSTLLRCINLLENPTSGQVFVDSIELTDKKTHLLKMRLKIEMVFQSFNLFSHKMNVENVMMGPIDLLEISRQEAFDRAVEYMRLQQRENLKPYPSKMSWRKTSF